MLRGTLRVPGDRLADALARLRQLGQVVEDTQGSQDVTDQIVDLDARLASARATEQRLTELLQNRTGKLSDVLEVERELTRVRLDIERLDAEKTNVGRRVSYATIDVTIREERKAGLDAGPLSLTTRIRIAAADGARSPRSRASSARCCSSCAPARRCCCGVSPQPYRGSPSAAGSPAPARSSASGSGL